MESSIFSVSRDLKFKAILTTEPRKSSSTVRALKCYLNEKNLMHGRVTTTISKFSPQIFETYFSLESPAYKRSSELQ